MANWVTETGFNYYSGMANMFKKVIPREYKSEWKGEYSKPVLAVWWAFFNSGDI